MVSSIAESAHDGVVRIHDVSFTVTDWADTPATRFTLRAGMSYQVADDAGAHRSSTATGATLFIVD